MVKYLESISAKAQIEASTNIASTGELRGSNRAAECSAVDANSSSIISG